MLFSVFSMVFRTEFCFQGFHVVPMVIFSLKELLHPLRMLLPTTSLPLKIGPLLSLLTSYFVAIKCQPLILTTCFKFGQQHYPLVKVHRSSINKTCTAALMLLKTAMHLGPHFPSLSMGKLKTATRRHGNMHHMKFGTVTQRLFFTISSKVKILRMKWTTHQRRFMTIMDDVIIWILCLGTGLGDRR